ncbi:hypothetical protein GCM10009624_25510 [Gordonia sinesedis]
MTSSSAQSADSGAASTTAANADAAPAGGTSAARSAYESLEPFHVLAYFNPGLGSAQADLDLDPHAFYVGARGAPLGDCDPSVVISAFYNFSPGTIASGWAAATARGLDAVADRRNRMLDDELRAVLGPRVDDPVIAEAADHFVAVIDGLPLAGRPLAAAWAATGAPAPDVAHLRLWHAIAVLREWRGDNHIATLVVHGLNGIDALTFHEAELPDPSVRRRVLGQKLSLLTRGWSEEQWDNSVDGLVERGLAERTDTGHRLTADGAALYDDIEATTDALGERTWSNPETQRMVTELRPYVKAIIDAGVLPGTRKR